MELVIYGFIAALATATPGPALGPYPSQHDCYRAVHTAAAALGANAVGICAVQRQRFPVAPESRLMLTVPQLKAMADM